MGYGGAEYTCRRRGTDVVGAVITRTELLCVYSSVFMRIIRALERLLRDRLLKACGRLCYDNMWTIGELLLSGLSSWLLLK